GNVILQRTGPSEYTYTADLNTGLPDAGPGKMSADGLIFYFDAMHNAVDIPHRLSRNSTAANFGNLQYFAGSFPIGFTWTKVHLIPDESVIVGNNNDVDLWEGNELFIADGFSTAGIADAWVDVEAIYPNPASSFTRVAPPTGWSVAQLCVLDANGRVCLQQRLSGATLVDVSDLRSGMYSVELAGNGQRSVQRLVVVQE
ncbi:MAG TPA: T9SS type A sorting domain-containing protein, partial [Flavobacteriales bacterium]|nr:T9SS type A sorting domain-containing protein [Flavobacteriales bacterium]